MDPATSTILISSVVSYLAKLFKDHKSVETFFDDFTEATVSWIKPVFVKEDGSLQGAIRGLQERPDSVARQDVAKSVIAVALEDNPDAGHLLRGMAETIEKRNPSLSKIGAANIPGIGNKIHTGIINSSITDTSINQSHSGNGDNVGSDKIIFSNLRW